MMLFTQQRRLNQNARDSNTANISCDSRLDLLLQLKIKVHNKLLKMVLTLKFYCPFSEGKMLASDESHNVNLTLLHDQNSVLGDLRKLDFYVYTIM